MRQSEAKAFLPIIEAWANGKTLLFKDHRGNWEDVTHRTVQFCEDVADYRIKPEPALRPWTEAEIEAECIRGTVLAKKSDQTLTRLSRAERGEWLLPGNGAWSPSGLLQQWTIAATGAPCGVYE